jgi:hypothetical protein
MTEQNICPRKIRVSRGYEEWESRNQKCESECRGKKSAYSKLNYIC